MTHFCSKLLGHRIISLRKNIDWWEEWYSGHEPNGFGLAIKMKIAPEITKWLIENNLRHVVYPWQNSLNIFFFKKHDAVLFKVTWG